MASYSADRHRTKLYNLYPFLTATAGRKLISLRNIILKIRSWKIVSLPIRGTYKNLVLDGVIKSARD